MAQGQDDLIHGDAVQTGVAGDLGYAEAFIEQEMIFIDARPLLRMNRQT